MPRLLHEQMFDKLASSVGVAQVVVPVFIDIRDFSKFSSGEEASDLAIYLKHIYRNIITDYFPKACYYKSTGDGLLVIYDCPENSLGVTVNEVVAASLRLVPAFKSMCSSIDAVNFATPDRLAIAIGRGSCCSLRSGKHILDYSGKLINTTARLLDIARPQGVVMDARVGVSLLDAENKKHFKSASVYLRGVAEHKPLPILHTEQVSIPARRLSPIASPKWIELSFPYKLAELDNRGDNFGHRIAHAPDPGSITCKFHYPKYFNGSPVKGVEFQMDCKHKLENTAGKHTIRLDYKPLAKAAKKNGVRPDDTVRLAIAYLPLE